MRPNDTKRRLQAGQAVLGTFCLSGSPLIAEALGHAGYDFIIVDLQHGESNAGNLLHMLQAVSCSAATPLVRVATNLKFLPSVALNSEEKQRVIGRLVCIMLTCII